MTWSDVKKTLTTPPPPRPLASKHPIFTRDPFSTKSFGPGHLVGAGLLVAGIVGLTKFVIARGQAEAEETRRLAQRSVPAGPPPLNPTAPTMAKVENARGQYGKQP
jgi:hypothetical protein